MLNTIPNEVFRTELGVVPITDKWREGRLQWFENFQRRWVAATVRRVESMTIEGAKRRAG